MAQSKHNIAIAGAGVMGLCATRNLVQAGHNVSIFDPAGEATDNASRMAGGMLAPWSEIEHLPLPYIEAAKTSLDFWRGFESFSQNGSLLIAHAQDAHMLQRFAAKLPGISNGETVTEDKIAWLEPALGRRFAEGIFLPGEALVEPARTLQSIAASQKIIPEKMEMPAAAKEFDYVIDCRGMGAQGDETELRGVKGEILVVENRDFELRRPLRLAHPRYPLYIVPRAGNVFMIGATLIESADDTVALKSALELMSALYSLHPSFGEAKILDIRAGIRPAYPDNLPRITVEDNIIRCNGLFRHGYLMAPVMARCVADFIAGKENEFMHLFFPCHPERSEGSLLAAEKVRSFAALRMTERG